MEKPAMIKKVRPAHEARQLALNELSEHLGAELQGRYLVGALPVFRQVSVRRNQTKSQKKMQMGMRFIVCHPSSRNNWVIDMSKRRKGQFHLQRLYENWKGVALLNACRRAEEVLAADEFVYHARILRMYGRVSEILWMHCKDNPNQDKFLKIHRLFPTEQCQKAQGIEPDQWIAG